MKWSTISDKRAQNISENWLLFSKSSRIRQRKEGLRTNILQFRRYFMEGTEDHLERMNKVGNEEEESEEEEERQATPPFEEE